MSYTIPQEEYNKLKKKADMWDLLEKIGPKPSGNARIQWHIDMSELRLKLKAIRTFLIEKVEYHRSRTDTVSDSCSWFAYKSTLEILEGEQPSEVKTQ